MFEIALPVLQIAWMGLVTTGFELTIDMLYMCYDTFWMGMIGNCVDACISIPWLGSIVDSIWQIFA